jgi:hypothetical protein
VKDAVELNYLNSRVLHHVACVSLKFIKVINILIVLIDLIVF